MPSAAHIDVPLLRKALRSGSRQLVERILTKIDPAELARAIDELAPGDIKLIIQTLIGQKDRMWHTLRAASRELWPELPALVGDPLVARILGVLDPEEATQLAQTLDDETRGRVLELTEIARRRQIERLLRYAPGSAGRRMSPRFVAVDPGATVGEAVRAIREAGPDVPVFYLYVVEGGRLVGVASLGQLVRARDDTPVRELMATDLVSVTPHADQEKVARLVSRRNLLAVPVLDDGELLGLVTVDDVIDVLEQQATRDLYNMAGLSEGDRVLSSPLRSLTKRLPWNLLNVCTSLLAATIVSSFEGTIAKLATLAVFMPVIAGIGGSTGNQTMTVIIRGITLGELDLESGLRVFFKELLVSLCIGLLLGSVVGVVAVTWKGRLMLGVCIMLAMIANLLIAAVVGTTIPLTLRRFGFDPALGGSILLTMCTDSFGFLAFLGLATLMLRYLM